jgi:ankyrin repeat protein
MALSNLGNQNCDEIVKLLLDKGADPNLGNVKKVTPLHILAAYKQHPELL